ncbi:MAG: hypothetical protein ACI845_002569 [Gammaproteobacteria bacterium]|jgi:hypothetical protein
MDHSQESRLSRWSRLKQESRESEANPALNQQVETISEPGSILVESPDLEQPVLTDSDMPDVESLNADSDFSGFMSTGVSDELRNLALRKMFSGAFFNIRDGLDEYDEDYTSFEKLGDIVTCDMKHQIEVQEQKLKEKLAAESEAEDALSQETEVTEDSEDLSTENLREEEMFVSQEQEPDLVKAVPVNENE